MNLGQRTLFVLAAPQEQVFISPRPNLCSASPDLLLPAQLDQDVFMNERGCCIVMALLRGGEQSSLSLLLSRSLFGG